jgi:hypothetical protein
MVNNRIWLKITSVHKWHTTRYPGVTVWLKPANESIRFRMLTHQNFLLETGADENDGEKTLFNVEKFSWDTKKSSSKRKKRATRHQRVKKGFTLFPNSECPSNDFYPERATVARFNTRMDKNLPWNKFLPHSSVMKSNMAHAWWLSYLPQLGEKIIHDDPKLPQCAT